MEGENSTLCTEANKRSDKLAEFLTVLAPESTPDELPEIIDNAENGYKLFAESVRTGTTPNHLLKEKPFEILAYSYSQQ